jgi:hypothetical protein
MRLLIKLPSRSRPDKLVSMVSKYIEYAADITNIKFIISLDCDDDTVSPHLLTKLRGIHPNVEVIVGESTSKIDAINRDIPDPSTFDILLLASDDMNPVMYGYDTVIREKMKLFYADTDGVLFFNDGFNNEKLNTIAICGSKYYKRFNYIYYPEYKSLFCDNEFTDTAYKLGKQKYFNIVIIKHEHPGTNSNVEFDKLYQKNQVYFEQDKALYLKRSSSTKPKILRLISS